MALNRFKNLQKDLTDAAFSDQYYKFINDIITQGEAELVPNDRKTMQTHGTPLTLVFTIQSLRKSGLSSMEPLRWEGCVSIIICFKVQIK